MTEGWGGRTLEEWRASWLRDTLRRDREAERLAPIIKADTAALADCPLKSPGAGTPGCCDLCGGELPRLKSGQIHPYRRWCSPECSDTYWNNHGWTSASGAALKRDDYRCVRCGSDGGTRRGTCWQDGDPWPCANAERPIQFPGDRRTYYHRELVRVRGLEVNHLIPRNGRGYHESCHHHLDLLETLCHECHLIVTAEQREVRRAGFAPPGPIAGTGPDGAKARLVYTGPAGSKRRLDADRDLRATSGRDAAEVEILGEL